MRGGPFLLAVASLALAGCGALVPGATPAPTRWTVPAGFTFVRDGAGVLLPGERADAEEQLRSYATERGVFGIVVTGDAARDEEAAGRQIMAEVSRLRGETLIAFCPRQPCDLSVPGTFSPGLADAVGRVAPAPAPAPGQGVPPPERGLRAWVEYVGALAFLDVPPLHEPP